MVLSIAPNSVRPPPLDTENSPVSLRAVGALLRGLNREQRRAVTHREGPQLVIAGPGTGKTEVVTRRVAWLIASKRARPREILALTFTDAAAEEMQARVDVLVPYGHADAAIHTFHALGDRLLREYAFELGLPGDVRLVSRAEAVVLLRENMFELGLARFLPLGDPTRFLAALVDLFMRAKDELVTPQGFAAHAAALRERSKGEGESAAVLADLAATSDEVASAFAAYQRLLERHGLMDHGDQIALPLRLLRDRPAVREEVAARYRYLLVDEFQDTNPAQLELVFTLTGQAANVTVVGDPDQAIYTFRGAAVSNVRRFVAAHRDLPVVVLRRNYRSRAPIVEASRRLIAHNHCTGWSLPQVITTEPVAQRRSRAPVPVRTLFAASADEEPDLVADHIARRLEQGASPSDFAVLLRTNGDADRFLASLQARGVPARASAPRSLSSQPAVRPLLAYLRVIADPGNSLELYLVAAARPYAVPGADLAALMRQARRRHVPLWDVLVQAVAGGEPDITPEGRGRAIRLVEDIKRGLEASPQRTSGEVLYEHLRRTGLLAELAVADRGGSGTIALRSVARFFDIVRSGARLLPEDRVAFLVPHLAALDEAGAEDTDAGPLDDQQVRVLTVHRAKGLEFRFVYLCGLVDGRFPSRGRPPVLTIPAELLSRREGADDEDSLAEERRLAYVAMTRARDELWLSHHAAGPNGRSRRRPSPFLAEALDSPPASAVSAHSRPLEPLEPRPPRAPDVAARRSPRDASLSLSYSQVDDYLACPERYRLRHVVGLPTPAHHALAYGSAMHQAVATFHLRRANGVVMSDEELADVLAAAWSPEGYLSREHEEARFAAGCAALRRFRAEQLTNEPSTVAIERPFSFPIGGDLVRGRMDRVDETRSGTVIVDYKSSEIADQSKADARARDSLQLQIYALAHQQATGALPHEVQLHFLDSGIVGRASPNGERLAKARAKITGVADGIRAGRFEPRPSPVNCGYCPFRQICPSSAA